MYPIPNFGRLDSLLSLISLRDPISMLYLSSTFATRAVRRSSLESSPKRVRSFHDLKLNIFFCLVFQPQNVDALVGMVCVE